uniref:Ubiquitin carboxyl-terminal hydrolase n=1 Tax=Chelonoidis abingdonii TaxID=106734 RepID=A0A8C0JF91_CHEAB
MMEIITAEQLMEYLGDYILDAKPKEISEIQRLNYEQNMSDAMAILHKLQTGLDVNVKFTGVRVFEYTPECIVFDLLDIPLYHGWLVDPQTADIVKAVGNCSYNQLVEKIICCKQSDNSELVSEGFVAEQFLNNTATQLTYHGLCELTSAVQEGELCVFFRNNHFSTMTKYKQASKLEITRLVQSGRMRPCSSSSAWQTTPWTGADAVVPGNVPRVEPCQDRDWTSTSAVPGVDRDRWRRRYDGLRRKRCREPERRAERQSVDGTWTVPSTIRPAPRVGSVRDCERRRMANHGVSGIGAEISIGTGLSGATRDGVGASGFPIEGTPAPAVPGAEAGKLSERYQSRAVVKVSGVVGIVSWIHGTCRELSTPELDGPAGRSRRTGSTGAGR